MEWVEESFSDHEQLSAQNQGSYRQDSDEYSPDRGEVKGLRMPTILYPVVRMSLRVDFVAWTNKKHC